MSNENTPVLSKGEMAVSLMNNNIRDLATLALIHMPYGTPIEKAEQRVKKEIINYQSLLVFKPDLTGCSHQSALIAIKQAISDGLSLSMSEGLVDLIPTKINGEWHVSYSPTANGALSIAYQSGSILDHKRPEIKYNATTGQVESVTLEFLVPSYPNPRWESVTLTKEDFNRLRLASARKNGGEDKANPNYTSYKGGIDPGFAATKTIKHGLKRRGTNMNEGKRWEKPSAEAQRVMGPPPTPYKEATLNVLSEQPADRSIQIERSAAIGPSAATIDPTKL